MTPSLYPTTTDDIILEEIMSPFPIRAADADYQDRLERGEERFAAAQERAYEIWRDEKAIVVALDDYCLTDDDIRELAQLRILMSDERINPAVLQYKIERATAGMKERVIEYAQDLIDTEEHFS